MIKIIKIRGGLGNQMFGYAFYLMIKKKYPFNVVLYNPLESWFAHNGFELGALFPTINVRKYKFYRRLMKVYSQYFSRKLFSLIIESPDDYGCYNRKYINSTFKFAVYDGYWQSDKYFFKEESIIRKYFTFDARMLNNESKKALDKINSCNAVSIHIRRGDYLHNSDVFGNICNEEYYLNAINYLKEIQEDLVFFFFSDDPEWVQATFVTENSFFIDYNKNNESWQDMFLMSNCKNNIIANSTFSWWGAWLNSNPSKIVIAPKKWFQNNKASNIIPEKWITL